MINDSHDPAHGFFLTKGQKADGRTVGKSFILFGIKVFPLILINRGDPVTMSLVDFGW